MKRDRSGKAKDPSGNLETYEDQRGGWQTTKEIDQLTDQMVAVPLRLVQLSNDKAAKRRLVKATLEWILDTYLPDRLLGLTHKVAQVKHPSNDLNGHVLAHTSMPFLQEQNEALDSFVMGLRAIFSHCEAPLSHRGSVADDESVKDLDMLTFVAWEKMECPIGVWSQSLEEVKSCMETLCTYEKSLRKLKQTDPEAELGDQPTTLCFQLLGLHDDVHRRDLMLRYLNHMILFYTTVHHRLQVNQKGILKALDNAHDPQMRGYS